MSHFGPWLTVLLRDALPAHWQMWSKGKMAAKESQTDGGQKNIFMYIYVVRLIDSVVPELHNPLGIERVAGLCSAWFL